MLTRLMPWLYARFRVGRWLRYPRFESLYMRAFFLYKRHVEDPFAGLVRRRPDLFRGGHVLDVGANVGYTASVFARALDDPFRVFAFEPEPGNARRMRKVIDRLGLQERVMAIEAAVGEQPGEVELVVNESHPGDHRVSAPGVAGPTIRVPMVTIDGFLAEHNVARVSFVKIDVQGFELAVSRGMHRLLEDEKRIAVAFELDEGPARSYGYDAAALCRFYESRGFRLFILTRRGMLLDFERRTLERMREARGYVDILALREAGS